jgi:hypothetical protein
MGIKDLTIPSLARRGEIKNPDGDPKPKITVPPEFLIST